MTDNVPSYYSEQIRKKQNEITKLEIKLKRAKDELDDLEACISLYQDEESLVEVREGVHSSDITEYWREKLIGSPCDTSRDAVTELILSELDRGQLCYLVSDMVSVITEEYRANLDALRHMVNRDYKNTMPGVSEMQVAIFKAIWGEDISTKSESEKHDTIRSTMERWPLELSFREICRAMRYWAQESYVQRSEAAKKSRTQKNKAELKAWVQAERRKQPNQKPEYFIAWIEGQPQWVNFEGKHPAKPTLYKWIVMK